MRAVAVVLALALGSAFGAWQVETVESPCYVDDNNPQSTSIAITASQQPAIAYSFLPGVASEWHTLIYAVKQGTVWQKETVLDTYFHGYLANLRLNTSGSPRIGAKLANQELVLVFPDSGGWTVDTVDKSAYIGDAALALTTTDIPHFAYHQQSIADIVYHAYRTGPSWTRDPAWVSAAPGQPVALDLGLSAPAFAPFLVFFEPLGDLVMMTRQAATWIGDTAFELTTLPNPCRIALLLDPIRVHAFYLGHDAVGDRSGLLHSIPGMPAWQTELVDGQGATLWRSPCGAAVDRSGHYHVVYTAYDSASAEAAVRYAFYDGATWSIEAVASGPSASTRFFGTQIAVDTLGTPHISFRHADLNAGNAAVKYAVRTEAPPPGVDEQAGSGGLRTSVALYLPQNPVRGAVSVRYSLPTGEAGRLDLLDASGRVVESRFLAASSSANASRLTPNVPPANGLRLTPNVPPGVYFIRLSAGGSSATVKVVSLR